MYITPYRGKREIREKEKANVTVFSEGMSYRGFIGVFVVLLLLQLLFKF